MPRMKRLGTSLPVPPRAKAASHPWQILDVPEKVKVVRVDEKAEKRKALLEAFLNDVATSPQSKYGKLPIEDATPQTYRNSLQALANRDVYIAFRKEGDKNVLLAARTASSIAGRTTWLGDNDSRPDPRTRLKAMMEKEGK